MTRTRIKICGITSVDDARLAVSMGADYIGVIFADSPRRIDTERGREIRAATTGCSLVGVFRDQSADEVVRIVGDVGIDLVQLHGEESPAFCDDVQKRTGRPVIKTFANGHIPAARDLAAYATTSYFLFDLERDADSSLEAIERVWTAAFNTRRKGFQVFLAGALDAANVREAIRRTGVFAVDVCRGVERSPGVKDPDSMQQFFAQARS